MSIYYTNGDETLSEDELVQRYRDDLGEIYKEFTFGGRTFDGSKMFGDPPPEPDPRVFRCGFEDWVDAVGWKRQFTGKK